VAEHAVEPDNPNMSMRTEITPLLIITTLER
jgi:hypothetical protein